MKILSWITYVFLRLSFVYSTRGYFNLIRQCFFIINTIFHSPGWDLILYLVLTCLKFPKDFVFQDHLRYDHGVANVTMAFVFYIFNFIWVDYNLSYTNLEDHYHLLDICGDWVDNLSVWMVDLNIKERFYFSVSNFYFSFDTSKISVLRYWTLKFSFEFLNHVSSLQFNHHLYLVFLIPGCW